MAKVRLKIPRSCTSFSLNLIGLIVYLITIHYLKTHGIDVFWNTIISIAALAITIIILEKLFLKRYHRISSGISFSNRNRIRPGRVLIKLLGLYITLGLAVLYYVLFPEYHSGFYYNYFRLAKYVLPIILIGSIPYFILLDRFMKDPYDSHWHVGMVMLGQWKKADKFALKNHFLGWLVKVFFLALMFTYLIQNTNYLMYNNLPQPKYNFSQFYDYMYNLIFAIDLVYVCAGYLLTLKILDSHIRTTEPSVLGWMAALACYQPFWSLIFNQYLHYDNGYYWGNLFGDHPAAYKLWGSVILLLFIVYILATIVFGVRFSNLTNRGIITNGPYRFIKHPAYISKNLAWWLISIPFISNAGVFQAITHSALLLGLNTIYYLRAITEERHLSLDPVYVEYATAMNERGIFSGLYKLLPFLKYDVNKYIQNDTYKSLFLTHKPKDRNKRQFY